MKDAKLLDGVEAGDLITATLTVSKSNDASITAVKKTGHKPIPSAS
jgi:hypothetical protein